MGTASRRLALVVGVNGPTAPDRGVLKYAANDAQDMAGVLQTEACGFELFCPPLLSEQASTEQMRRAVVDLAEEIQDGDFVLFYFSGHAEALPIEAGMDDVFFVTSDFNPARVQRDNNAHLSLSWLRKVLFEHEKASSVLIILDCCYAGKFNDTAPDPYLEELQKRLKYYFEGPSTQSPSRPQGVRLALTAAGSTTALEKDGHGLLTGLILSALRGECKQAVNKEGQVTFASLLTYLNTMMPPDQQPHFFGGGHELLLATYLHLSFREQLLRSMIADRNGFLQDRLESFVGREQQLAEVRQYIDRLLPTGGYLSITGPAGQGKSSIIAKLVDSAVREQHTIERVVFHFIPLTPPPDYQIALLRNLMARLILKYDLPDFFLASESRAALSEAFPRVLKEIADKGGQEIIFIDGLDQLQADQQTGQRDLSFLPQGPGNPPRGIIFVLGTRPNDTLQPLALLKPYHEYQLPNLSRADFDHILQHHRVTLKHALADRFYETLDENALYLDLAAIELAARDDITDQQVEEIVRQLADDPENLFSLTINRLRRQETLWNVVIKPVVGLLLEAKEPLAREHLKQLLNLDASIPIDGEQLNRGLDHLGGLVVTDEHRRYTLFHLKFRDYLRRDPKHPDRTSLFDAEDEQHWHQRFVDWCERGGQGGLATIWDQATSDIIEQGRRHYAREHYIPHLFGARDWLKLFSVLDEGAYGRAKVRHDSSTRTYVLDLDVGREAAASGYWDQGNALNQLPRLWQYTLLRCSLASRADNYPIAAFRLMLLLGEETKVLGLAELLMNPEHRSQVFLCIARHLMMQPERNQEAAQLFLRTEQMIPSIHSERSQAGALIELGNALAQAGSWQEADRIWREVEQMIRSFSRKEDQARTLTKLARGLAQAERWQDAERVIRSLSQKRIQAQALIELGRALVQADQWKEAGRIWREVERMLPSLKEAGIKARVWRKQSANKVIGSSPIWSHALVSTDLARALIRAELWQDAERVTRSISSRWSQAETLTELGSAFAQVQCWTDAERIWEEAERVSNTVSSKWSQARALTKLGDAFASVQRWQDAERVWRDAEHAARSSPLRRSSRPLTDLRDISREIFILSTEWSQARVLIELGSAFARAKRWRDAERVWRDAEQVIRSFSSGGGQARVALVQERILALAQSGQDPKRMRQEVKRLIRSTSSEWSQARALVDLSSAWAKAGRWQESERLLQSISREKIQAWARTRLGNMLAEAGLWQDAERVMHSISNEGSKAEALTELARRLAEAGYKEDAERIWQDAEQVLLFLTHTKEGSKAQALTTLGSALALAQQGEDAERVWQEAERVLLSLSKGKSQAEALTELASILTQTGRWQDSERVISSIPKEGNKVEALTKLGYDLAKAGRWQDAERIWRDTRRVIHFFPKKESKVWALTNLGGILAETGRWQDAERVWRYAEQTIRSLHHQESRTWALVQLGSALAQAKHWQEAERVIQSIPHQESQALALLNLSSALARAECWRDAKRIIDSIPQGENKVWALIELSSAFAQAECWQDAERIWGDAEQAIYSFSRKRIQARMLTKLARVLAMAERWQDAERVIDSIPQGESKVWALTELSGAFVQAGRWQDAERVINLLSHEGSKVWALTKLGSALAQAQRWQDAERIWQEAEQMIHMISKEGSKARALIELGSVMAQAHRWQDAERVWENAVEAIHRLPKERSKVELLYRLADTFARYGEYHRIVNLVQREWLHAASKDNALALSPLICGLIPHDPDLGIAFYNAFTWVDLFLRG